MQPHHRTVHPCLLSHLCRRALRADLGWNGVGYHNPQVSTPTIDALAGGGLKLDGFYTYKVCAPARASFLTGRFPFHLAATKTNFAYFWTLCVCPPRPPAPHLRPTAAAMAMLTSRPQQQPPTRREGTNLSYTMFPEKLQQAGYRTHMVG
jgi:arylsulfatase A-like enzyme